jgi:hypothetical protein
LVLEGPYFCTAIVPHTNVERAILLYLRVRHIVAH